MSTDDRLVVGVAHKYSALYNLWEAFLHMRAWNLPDYESLDDVAREQFTELVRTRALFTYVEDCKRDLVRNGVDVPDRWLAVLCAGRVIESSPLPPADRDRLGAILDEMYPMLVRLDPDSHPAAGPNTDRQHAQASGMSDAIRRAGAALEWVRCERDDLAPAHDSKERYTKAQYDHIREHGCDSYPPGRGGTSTVPNWDTWSRYVREYLKIIDGRMNSPRGGRTGRSLVRPEDLRDLRGER